MKKRLLMLSLAMVFLVFKVFAQQRITGKVTAEEDGLPLPGVSVKIKGSASGTSTGMNGEFAISASKGQVLVFSFVGFAPLERTVGDDAVMNVKLGSDTKSLNEVVVVGYGTQKKGNLTGAVSTIDIKKTIEGRPVADAGRAIQGAAAGVSVTIPSGEVGSDPIIKIRGQIGSIRGGSSPLILLDNVEIPSIQLVNPNDIASISILKDAASSSIYGAKAAFGVVLITTKQGSGSAKPQVNFSSNFSYQNPWKDLQMADVNALKYSVDAIERVGGTSTGAFYKVDRASYNKAVEWKEKYGNTIGADDPTVFGRDWYVLNGQKYGVRTYDPYSAMVKEWAPTQQHNLSVGGTVNKTSYNIGLAALNQSGMMKPSKSDEFSRYNASLRVSSEINKYFTARAGAIYARRNKDYAYITNSTTADPWLYIYRWSPLFPLGSDENGDPIRSPASEAAAANTANILQSYMNVNFGGTVNILKNWKIDVDYAFSNQNETWNRPGTRYTARNSWVAPKARVDAAGNPVYVNSQGQVVASTEAGAMVAYDLSMDTYTAAGTNPDHLYRSAEDFKRHTLNAYTTFDYSLNKDNTFKFLLGLNRVADDVESQWTQVTNLSDITNPQFNFGVGTYTGGGDKFWEAQLGYFSRINYGFKDKYLLEGNLRYDGSSKFPTDLQWRWFPSFSAAWVVSKEGFMEWSNPVLSNLKFRGSWGSIGDQTVPNTLYLPLMDSGPINWIGGSGAKANYVGSPAAISSSVKWQDIETKGLGLDASFFNSRLGLSFDVYQRNTNNMIVPAEGVPLTLGVSAPESNYGSLETKGWEFAIDFNHKFSNGLGINFRGNVSDAKSIITAYGSTKGVNSNYVGRTVGEIWGYKTDRLYQLDDFELDANGNLQLINITPNESAKYGKNDPTALKAYKLKSGPNGEKPVYQVFLQNSSNFRFGPGDVKFVDSNGDGELNNGNQLIDDYGDLEIIGNSTPRYEYGFRLGADFKGFDVSAFFQGVGSRKIWGNGSTSIAGYASGDGAMPEAIASNYWTPDNTGAFYPRAYDLGGANTGNNMQIQTRYLLNMAYLRLKNLTVGYSLPKSLLKKVNISSLRVYTALENFITWDKLGDLPIDPEAINGYSMWNSSNYNSGRTGVGVPAFKTASFGIQLNF
ncbi:SusC/RagA family TonB-linked outer membrane protein [Desertivirga arenae]|uniref:SusC/RagA family TonB-linked outer membrane protein n=1 Tax=Desertivirga arenae TaxID=2810309 RepID=UPI001A963E7C|nr:TonB-dependent receptor [Pedobacter sp. SYSU D00823]